jgi:hypothetical protein
MHLKPIGIATIAGGIILLAVTFIAEAIAQLITPYDIFAIGGMRAMDDPIMSLFFLYPFVFALIAAVVFDLIQPALTGDACHRGLLFAVILFIIVIIPNMWVIFSSMTYPLGFYVSNILTGLIAYPLLGILYVRIWEKYSS